MKNKIAQFEIKTGLNGARISGGREVSYANDGSQAVSIENVDILLNEFCINLDF